MNNADSKDDLSSQSLPTAAVSSHIELDWLIDFDAKTLSGSATHSITITQGGTLSVLFDSKCLDLQPKALIFSEASGLNTNATATVSIEVGASSPLGQRLSIPVPEALRTAGSSFRVKFFYSTGIDAPAIQWLDPCNTAGKLRPYVFTQVGRIYIYQGVDALTN